MWPRAVHVMCLTVLVCWAGQAVADPPRLALIIGNSTYAGLPPLPGCAASANVVSVALKRAGFETTERLNVSNGRMGAAITELGDAIAREPGGVAVAYVCGYTVGFDGRVFLLPASASLERETDALTQGVVGRLLVSTVMNSEAKAGLVLLDSAALPGRAGPLPLEAMVNPAMLGSKGFIAAHSTTTLPGGPTPLAAAIAAGFAPPAVEARAMLQDIGAALQGMPSLKVVMYEPASPAWVKSLPAVMPAPAMPIPIAAAAAPTPASGVPAVLSEADRRRMQLALQRLGYYSGKVDGAYGPETMASIRRFQHELGTEMTGRLTTEQAGRLLADGR